MNSDHLSVWLLLGLNVIAVILIAYVVLRVIAAGRVKREPKVRRLAVDSATLESLIRSILTRNDYKLVDMSETTVVFKTGVSRRSWRGQTMTAAIRWIDKGSVEIKVSGEPIGSVQFYDWNEADVIAKRFLNDLMSEVSSSSTR